ncbi:hypothetical protein NF27_EY00150 [Candidatus Jidaibacter acanthamoeba]|uniref:DNA 3'-5' helicase n=1 Tax=Candidatus Jidaibacter acanthamoebae TaxID=86105 RepID=A0A0C1QH93_9RICK|nr:UvrD-helicase domain-containing protein [Candidatus Jidaibacter acanthamoeba]KIE04919.1 hypothetical protein NF27_EY00150 [Candidatus Jidaibacter acanthamoeba]
MFERIVSEVTLSPEEIQALASDPACSVYLSASAGTGKTKVLTDRYLRLLLDDTEAKKILCLTFTNAAAAEMRQRIMQKLQNWSLCSQEELENELLKLQGNKSPNLIQKARKLHKYFSEEIDSIKIQTIHSFCLDILKKYSTCENSFYSYEIIEDHSKKKFLKLAFEQVFNTNTTSSDHNLKSSVGQLISFYDYDRLEELVQAILAPRIKFLRYLSKFNDEEHLKQGIYHKHEASPELSGQEILAKAMELGDQMISDKILNLLSEEGEQIGNAILQNKDSFIRYKRCFLKADGERFARLVKASFAKKYPDVVEILTREQERVYDVDQTYKKYISAELCFSLTLFCKRILEIYEALKAEEQLFEYDDLIIKTLDLLQNSESSYWILYKLDMAIDHILVDEAQDLSEIQWELIKSVSEEFFAGEGAKDYDRTVFIVGDFKQSIYSFQGADPKEFEAARAYFEERATNALKVWKELNLSTSFRTTAPILGFIDSLLGDNHAFIHNYTKHIPFRNGSGYIGMLPLIEKPKNKESEGWHLPEYEDDIKHNQKKLLAKQIVTKIDEWITSKRKLYGHLRAIEPKDIMILVRKRSELIDYLIAELKKHKIPVVEHGQSNLQENLLIMDLLSLIKFINLQSDDYNLACLLKSPIIALYETQLFEICHARETSIWESLELKNPDVFKYLENLKNSSHALSILELINKVLYIDEKYQIFIERYGDGAKDLINIFIEAIIKFETSSFSLCAYQEFVEWFKDYKAKFGSLVHNDKLRIMTVHGSKGLQAPIVIIADSASSEQSPVENVYWDKNEDLYLSCYSEFDCEVIKLAKEFCNSNQERENLRLLYVALTRAEDELYIGGWENNRIKGSWYDLISKKHDNNIEVIPNYAEGEAEIKNKDKYIEVKLDKSINLEKKKIIRPSLTKKVSVNPAFMERGKVIHKLLHELPQIPQARWNNILEPLDESIKQDLLLTIKAFPDIFFSVNSISELPIVGELNGSQLNAQIDKIIFKEDFIQIIDFKTDTRPNLNKVKNNYIIQLKFYKQLLQKKYRQTPIKIYLLFSSNQELIEIFN